MSSMKFNNRIFYVLLYYIADFKQVLFKQCFKVLMLTIETAF